MVAPTSPHRRGPEQHRASNRLTSAARAAMGRWKAAHIHVPSEADLSGFMGAPPYTTAPSPTKASVAPARSARTSATPGAPRSDDVTAVAVHSARVYPCGAALAATAARSRPRYPRSATAPAPAESGRGRPSVRDTGESLATPVLLLERLVRGPGLRLGNDPVGLRAQPSAWERIADGAVCLRPCRRDQHHRYGRRRRRPFAGSSPSHPAAAGAAQRDPSAIPPCSIANRVSSTRVLMPSLVKMCFMCVLTVCTDT